MKKAKKGHCRIALEWSLSRCILGKWKEKWVPGGPTSPVLQGKHGKSMGQRKHPLARENAQIPATLSS